MNKVYILLLVLSFLIFSCKKNSDKDLNQEQEYSNAQVFIGNTSKIYEVSGQLAENSIPTFSWFSEKDQKIDLIQYKGKPIIINFWATWCPPCKKELPDLIRVYNNYKSKGLIVIGVSIDNELSLEELAAFVGEQQINYQIVLDNGMLSSYFGGVTAIPTTFFINKEFRAVDKVIGALNESDLVKKVEGIL